jgi:predicted RNase H-like HicB family nuclease
MKQYDTMHVLQAAVAAYELNNNSYIKEDVKKWCPSLSEYKVIYWTNRQIVRHYFRKDFYSAQAQTPPTILINDNHKSIAEDIRQFTKRAIFSVLAKPENNLDIIGFPYVSAEASQHPSYEEEIYRILMNEKTDASWFGYICSVPSYYFREKSIKLVRDRLKNCKNEHFGEIESGALLEEFEIIEKFKSKKYDGHVVKGICDEKFFLFFTTRPMIDIHIGSKVTISGNITHHIYEDDIALTKLNRVMFHKVVNP